MTEWLLLRVAREPEGPWSWAVVDAAGQLLVAPGESTGAPLLAAAAGRRVALLLPGADVALLSATLPAGNEARLLPLVPFALEDQVSQDIELLHFALGPRDTAGGPMELPANLGRSDEQRRKVECRTIHRSFIG